MISYYTLSLVWRRMFNNLDRRFVLELIHAVEPVHLRTASHFQHLTQPHKLDLLWPFPRTTEEEMGIAVLFLQSIPSVVISSGLQ